MPIHIPKIMVFGDLTPKWGDISTEPPKGTSLHGKISYDVLINKIGPLVQPVHVPMRPKKTKEETFQLQTRYSPRPPTSSNRNTVWRGGWSSGISYKFQVSSTSAEWLPSYEGSKNKKKWSPLLRPVAYTTAYSHTAVISMISVCLLQPVGYEVSILMTLCGISLTTHGLKCVLCYSKYGGRWREISWWMVWS